MPSDERYERVLAPIRERLRPDSEDQRKLKRAEDALVLRLRKVVPSDVEIGLMGSVAKGTALRHNRDLDVFLLIPRHFRHEDMTREGLRWARKAMRGLRQSVNYAQHPYLQVHLKDVKVDIVPSYKIDHAREMGSAVDRSQLHTHWMNQRLADPQRDDIRLLKQFCKNLGVYGAQLKVEGFSGYLCELLVVHYGSFLGLLEAAAWEWRRPVLDPGGRMSEKQAGEKFPDAAMVVIDPVDADRNVSAVVSHTSRSRFMLQARRFLEKPSAEFFFHEKEIHSKARLKAMIRARGTHSLLLSFPVPDEVEDVLWPQLKKTALALLGALEAAEFRPFGHYYWTDGKRGILLMEVMEEELPAVIRRAGPPLHAAKDVEAFLARHRGAMNLHVEHERVVAVEPRAARTPKEAIEAALARAGGARLGIPAGFLKGLKRRRWGDAYSLLRDAALREVASDYFSRRL